MVGPSICLSVTFWAAAPKGAMTYAFTHMGDFLLLLLLLLLRPPPLIKSQPLGLNPNLKAQILAARPKSQPWGPNPNLRAQLSALRLKTYKA